MDWDIALKAAIAAAPVLLLLLGFDRLDVFNLVSFRRIVLMVLLGAAVAAASYLVNWRVMDGFPIGFTEYAKYIAPPIEETLKALAVVGLFAANRIGFKLDAAISGFAVGAGFSVVENGWFLHTMADASLGAWIVRGFGTAIMHGGATALFAVIAHEMGERQSAADVGRYRFNPLLFVPGLVVAILVHSAFNHFPHQPLLAMAGTLLLVPLTLFLVFARSETATRRWLQADAEEHRAMLEQIRAGRFAETEAGRALLALSRRFPEATAGEITAYVALKTELVLRAEELMLAAQDGRPGDPAAEDREKFLRLAALERDIGRPALAALRPMLPFSRNDLWELRRLRTRAMAAETQASPA